MRFVRSLLRRVFGDGYAHCACGRRLSDWFTDDRGFMWCPTYIDGCGRVSEYGSHAEWRGGL